MVGGRQGAARGGKARAMAMRWMVALVEPPVTITRRTAFSKACMVMMKVSLLLSLPLSILLLTILLALTFIVMMSRGLMSSSMHVCSAATARRTSAT